MSTLVFKELRKHALEAQELTSSAKGNVQIHRTELVSSQAGLPFVLRPKQFPVNS